MATWSSVVLPAPFGPTMPITLPRGSVRSQFDSALTLPYRLVSAFVSTTASMCAPLSRERILKCDGEERRHAVAIESCVDGPREPGVERLSQGRLHRPLERLGGVLSDEGPRTGARVSEPLAFELAIGLQHRVRVDRE